MKTELVTITPQIAEDWLKRNDSNWRSNMDLNRVKRIAYAIQRGEWVVNGETIKFGTNGKLVDGQHRLAACKESGEAIVSLVVYGVMTDNEIDTGTPRTLPQYMKRAGEKDTAQLASVTRIVYVLLKGGVPNRFRDCRRDLTYTNTMRFLKLNHASLTEACEKANYYRKRVPYGITPRMCGGFYYIFSRINREMADHLFDGLSGLKELQMFDPVRALREVFIAPGMVRNRSEKMYPEINRMALIIKAWNALLKDKQVRQLTWRGTGPGAQKFPTISGADKARQATAGLGE
jgi:hypothetical protein